MQKKAKVGVILAGCGHRDGSEINEAVMTLLALRLEGFEPQIFAPKRPQADLINHLNGEKMPATRDLMEEAARIARGQVKELSEMEAASDGLSALVLPGGFGMLKNFSNYLEQGPAAQLDPTLESLLNRFLLAKKPIMAVCISPLLVGLAAKKNNLVLELTLGDTENREARFLSECGLQMKACPSNSCVVDEVNKVVSTPAYMQDVSLDQIWPGIVSATQTLKKWTH